MLRREAERLILPNLPAFRRGEYQPQENDERLALLAGQIANYEFEGLQGAAVRLYSDVFAAEPKLADDVPAGASYRSVARAVLAGCGQGKDVDQLNDEDRGRLRRQALGWFRQELTLGWGQAAPTRATRKPTPKFDRRDAAVAGRSRPGRRPRQGRPRQTGRRGT